jgi:hypothetical protein
VSCNNKRGLGEHADREGILFCFSCFLGLVFMHCNRVRLCGSGVHALVFGKLIVCVPSPEWGTHSSSEGGTPRGWV